LGDDKVCNGHEDPASKETQTGEGIEVYVDAEADSCTKCDDAVACKYFRHVNMPLRERTTRCITYLPNPEVLKAQCGHHYWIWQTSYYPNQF